MLLKDTNVLWSMGTPVKSTRFQLNELSYLFPMGLKFKQQTVGDGGEVSSSGNALGGDSRADPRY